MAMKSESHNNKVSLARQIQELALRQLDLALEQVTKPARNYDEAIHETRRCLKRVRAILRLVREELSETTFDRDNFYLRDVGRRLAALRDAAVVLETFDDLKNRHTTQFSRRSWRELKKELCAQRPSTQSLPKTMAAIANRLRTARRRVGNWEMDFDEEAVLRKGIAKIYKKGSRVMKEALDAPTAENFHEWRKQVNHLRHQLQILQHLNIGDVKEPLQKFKALARTLGLNNDLAVLSQQFHHSRPKAGDPIRESLQELIRAHSSDLKSEAAHLGQQLYKRKTKDFIKFIWPDI